MRLLKLLLGVLIAAAVVGHAPAAWAQGKLANRPIRLLVPFAPGGGVDVVARIVGRKVGDLIGQPVLVESKPGAGGAIAVNELMRADPDGTTLLMTTSAHATLPALNKLSWDPSNDFTPIANIYSTMFLMPTNKASTAHFKNLSEFISYAKANPGKLSWGSSGIGGPQHLVGAHFMQVAGLNAVHVPYRGNAPMLQGLLQNEVQLTFDTATLVYPHVQDGQLAALAVTGRQRLEKMPDVPTVKEATGLDFSSDIWIFVIGPKGIPEAVQNALNKEFNAALDDKTVRDRITGFGLDVPARDENTPANLKKHIDGFAATYGKLIKDLGIRAE